MIFDATNLLKDLEEENERLHREVLELRCNLNAKFEQER